MQSQSSSSTGPLPFSQPRGSVRRIISLMRADSEAADLPAQESAIVQARPLPPETCDVFCGRAICAGCGVHLDTSAVYCRSPPRIGLRPPNHCTSCGRACCRECLDFATQLQGTAGSGSLCATTGGEVYLCHEEPCEDMLLHVVNELLGMPAPDPWIRSSWQRQVGQARSEWEEYFSTADVLDPLNLATAQTIFHGFASHNLEAFTTLQLAISHPRAWQQGPNPLGLRPQREDEDASDDSSMLVFSTIRQGPPPRERGPPRRRPENLVRKIPRLPVCVLFGTAFAPRVRRYPRVPLAEQRRPLIAVASQRKRGELVQEFKDDFIATEQREALLEVPAALARKVVLCGRTLYNTKRSYSCFSERIKGLVDRKRELGKRFITACHLADLWRVPEPVGSRHALPRLVCRAFIKVCSMWGWPVFGSLVALGFVGITQPVAAPREQPAGFQPVRVAQPVAAQREQPAGFQPVHLGWFSKMCQRLASFGRC